MLSLVPSLHMAPGEKQSSEQSQIIWAVTQK